MAWAIARLYQLFKAAYRSFAHPFAEVRNNKVNRYYRYPQTADDGLRSSLPQSVIMIRAIQLQSSPSLAAIISHIIDVGQMSRDQYLLLTSAMLSGQSINEHERHQVNRVLDYLQTGRVKLVEQPTIRLNGKTPAIV